MTDPDDDMTLNGHDYVRHRIEEDLASIRHELLVLAGRVILVYAGLILATHFYLGLP